MPNDLLGIGLTGTALTDLEREILRENSPYAVVLFGRNIETEPQLRALVDDVKRTAARPPLIMIDQEGGRVDRLRHLVPGMPSAEAFEERADAVELAGWFGRVIGMSLRWFDMEVDLAPVVDILAGAPPKGLERRMFGSDPERVVELAGAFLRGLQSQGVAGCLKHWPGIGAGFGNPHYGATVIDVPFDELRARDLVPFAKLGAEAGAVMIGHGTYPRLEEEPDLPASLSPYLSSTLLREAAGFTGVAISDDMEMHAVSDLASYEEIAERALVAGNDVILFCSHTERIPEIDRHLRNRVEHDESVRRRYQEALRRAEVYRGHCEALRLASAPPPSFEAVLEEADRFSAAFAVAHPQGTGTVEVERRQTPRSTGKGRSGREEWT